MEGKPDKRAGTVLKTDCAERHGMQVLCPPPLEIDRILYSFPPNFSLISRGEKYDWFYL